MLPAALKNIFSTIFQSLTVYGVMVSYSYFFFRKLNQAGNAPALRTPL